MRYDFVCENPLLHVYAQRFSLILMPRFMGSYLDPTRKCLRLYRAGSDKDIDIMLIIWTWWRHQMETFSALLALCAGTSPATGEFPAHRPVTRSFDIFFDLRLNKHLR